MRQRENIDMNDNDQIIIIAENLSKSYGEFEAVKGIDS